MLYAYVYICIHISPFTTCCFSRQVMGANFQVCVMNKVLKRVYILAHPSSLESVKASIYDYESGEGVYKYYFALITRTEKGPHYMCVMLGRLKTSFISFRNTIFSLCVYLYPPVAVCMLAAVSHLMPAIMSSIRDQSEILFLVCFYLRILRILSLTPRLDQCTFAWYSPLDSQTQSLRPSIHIQFMMCCIINLHVPQKQYPNELRLSTLANITARLVQITHIDLL